jgi:hypothetical protein
MCRIATRGTSRNLKDIKGRFAMRRSSRLRVATFLGLVVSVLGVLGALWNWHRPVRCRLSDGTIFTVCKLTLGTKHSWNPRGPLLIKLQRWVPERFDWLLGPPNLGPGFGTGSDSLALWTTVSDPIKGQSQSARQIGRLELVDGHGCVFRANGWGTCSSRGTNPLVASCFFFSAFPRRSREFTLRLYDSSGRLDGELKLQNPSPRSPSEWRAEPLPAIRTCGDLQIILEGIEVTSEEMPTIGQTRPSSFSPRFKLIQNGEPARGWALDNSGFWDATGNWGTALCAREPVWKVIATLRPTPEPSFPSNRIRVEFFVRPPMP